MDAHQFWIFELIQLVAGSRAGRAALLVISCLILVSCASKNIKTVHGKRSLEPAGFAQAATSPGWDVAVVRASEGTGAHDYTGSKLLPVLLVFKNKGPDQPQVFLEDLRGVASDGGEYLVYSESEAYRLASAHTFKRDYGKLANKTAWGAGIGAAVGAGAGTLAFLLGAHEGANLIWQGALVGGGLGALTGAATSTWQVGQEEREIIRADLSSNGWQEDPIPVGSTRMGYLFLPEGVGIASVRITIRDDSGNQTRDLTIATAKEYDPGRAKSVAAASQAAPAGPPKNASSLASNGAHDLPAPKKVPGRHDI